jgi:hypothetical protein
MQESDSGEQTLTLFHQVLAAQLYEALVPGRHVDARARHLAMAFAACGDDVPLSASVITGAWRGNQGGVLPRLLELTWEDVRAATSEKSRIAVAVAWLFTALGRRFSLNREPYRSGILELFTERALGLVIRPACIVAYEALPGSRDAILAGVRRWLETNPDDPAWPATASEALRRGLAAEVAEAWLEDHIEVPGSVDVLVALPTTSESFKRRCIDALLADAPPAQRDVTLWEQALGLQGDTAQVHSAIVRRAAHAWSNRAVRTAGEVLAPRIEDHVLRLALQDNLDAPRMPQLLRSLAHAAPPHSPLTEVIARAAITLLERTPEADDWPATWNAMYATSGPARDLLDEVARTWLAGYPTRPGWSTVALSVAARDLPESRRDLRRALRRSDGSADGRLCRAAGAHVVANPDTSIAPRLLQALLTVDSSPGYRELARAWLLDHMHHAGWPYVWQALCRHRPTADDYELGQAWLSSAPEQDRNKIVRTRLERLRRSAWRPTR